MAMRKYRDVNTMNSAPEKVNAKKAKMWGGKAGSIGTVRGVGYSTQKGIGNAIHGKKRRSSGGSTG